MQCAWQLMACHADVLYLHSTPLKSAHYADKQQLVGMAAAFATLPCKVLWRLTPKEVPDASAIAELKLSNNTKVGMPLISVTSCMCTSAMQGVNQWM